MALSNLPVPQSAAGRLRSSNTLGDILVEVGVISQEQLNQALAASGGTERDLGKWLVDLGFTTEEKIMKGIGIKAKVPYFTSLDGLFTAESANIISEELARRLQVVPLFKIENVATVAMSNPLDVFTIDTLVKTTGFRIDPVVCMRTTIFDTINKLYGGLESAQLTTLERGNSPNAAPANLVIEYSPSSGTPGAAKESKTPAPAAPALGFTVQSSSDSFAFDKLIQDIKTKLPEQRMSQTEQYKKDVQRSTEDMPIVQLVDAVFKQAVAKKASDIHIEPFADHTEIRFRIDGVLHPIMTIPKEFENSVIARIKVMANLDITETRQPQDGRVMTEVVNRPVDLRISTLPIIHGEKTVIRILDKTATEFKLSKLGFSEASENTFKESLDRPNGIILVTGPTGSGKSTTLYTALTILNSPDRNIVTLEDPVEYQLPRINQVQVNTKVGLTFAKGLRSILRQDPDVIMVGEIRDQETAEIAIQSALTGHLVLATLHTNDAPSAITRLMNMHVEPFLISASVLLIIAQRLVRVLCKECKAPYEPPAALIEKLSKKVSHPPASITYYKAVGCDRCNQTGYKGRMGVYEMLRMTSQLRELTVAEETTLDTIRNAAKEQGMRSLFEEGVLLTMNGLTTVEEMMRVCMTERIMPTYQYIASNPKGQSVRGSVPATDKGEVAKKLQQQGLFLVSCKSDEETVFVNALKAAPKINSRNGDAATAPLQAWWSSLASMGKAPADPRKKPKGEIALKELTVLTRQISISINAGMSFVDALQSMVQHAKNPLAAYTLRQVLDDVLSGKKFSEALARHPDIFKPVYVSMAAAGEAGGFMPEALNRVAEFLEKEMELKSKIKSAMVYPMMIAIVATVVVTGMMIFIVPTFVNVFKSMNAELPLPTRILVSISNFVRHGGFLAPVAVVGLYIGLKRLCQKNESVRRFWDEKVLGFPLFGKLVTLEIITRFIRTLSSLVDNGVMALEALGVARQVVENRSIEKVVDEIYASVQQGNGISPVLYKSKYFPVLVANMVATGEKTGAIPEVLTKMADYYDSEVSVAVRDILTMMEPLMIVVMALIVGFIIAGLMLPTFQMSSLIK